ncbi:MAG: glycerol kinase GlpK [Bacteroidales bacterium]|nr:glycerol kinase GlpK [Bacteroidales bacterium]
MKKYILALDQGTSSSRAIIFDHDGTPLAVSQKEFTQHFPRPGWVEHDPEEIWASESGVMLDVVAKCGIDTSEIAAVGITNQRETTIVWDAQTGKPVYNAIVWQDRRTSEYCDSLKALGLTEKIQDKTGLLIDAYFSGTKIRWILENVDGARDLARQGRLRFGTVDSWLIWKLTGGQVHCTDVTNASRTMLFNIHTLRWDEELLNLLGIPASMMPQVRSCSEVYGSCELLGGVPVAGAAGDQQSALFGQMCTEPGEMKNTYGTGCFLLMNSGSNAIKSQNKLLTTIAWKIGDRVDYALEGSVFVAGSIVQWLRDGLGLVKQSSEIEALASQVPDNGGVYLVPALTGLGAPYWDPYAKGTITGITRGTTAAHIARAALEGIAFETMDVVDAMRKDAGISIRSLKVDGGASRNNLMMQFQADILGTEVVRPVVTETTALGAAYLAGLAVGFWTSLDSLKEQWKAERTFSPAATPSDVESAVAGWKNAISRTLVKQ